jgi:hypothetical protein
MRTTLGELVSDLVDRYERLYHDHELATIAASVRLGDILAEHEAARRREQAPTVRIRRVR